MKRRLLIAGMVVGSLLMLSPFIGLLGTVFGMARAFETLGSSGVGDPQVLSSNIGEVLISTAAGVLLLPVGLIVFIPSLILFCRLPAPSPPPLPDSEAPNPL